MRYADTCLFVTRNGLERTPVMFSAVQSQPPHTTG